MVCVYVFVCVYAWCVYERLIIYDLSMYTDRFLYVYTSEKAFLSKNVLHDQHHIYFSWLMKKIN